MRVLLIIFAMIITMVNYSRCEDYIINGEIKVMAEREILKKELIPERLVNKTAPEFTLPNREGKAFRSTELMKGKKYILIDFWASWCGPCRREIPNLKHMYELYASKGLQIISISTDQEKVAWEKALDKEKMPWPNLLNEKGVDDLYFVKTIPAIFLVDASTGKVMDDKLRGESLDQKLEEIFGF